MNLFSRIKPNPTRTPAAVYRSAISSGKNAWKTFIKQRWVLFILSGEWIWRNDFKLLRVTLAVLAFILSIAILWHVFDVPGANWIDDRLGTATKLETIKILTQALFGLVVIFGLYVAYMRARALGTTAKAQQETTQAQQETAEAQHKTAQAQHSTNEQKMFNDATKQLGNELTIVRLGGIYALDKLARLHLERANQDDLASIVKILCAYLREITQQKNYQENHRNEPSNEIQSLLKVLTGLNKSSEEKKEDRQPNPVRLDLSGAYLVGANLSNACLKNVILEGTNLQKASLIQTQMQGALLQKTQMQWTTLYGTQMQGAFLQETQMQWTFLQETQMQGALLLMTQMQRAVLQKTQMQRALLAMTQMQGARLQEPQMQEAHLQETQMQGAVLQRVQMQGAVLQRVQMQGALLQETQMQGALLQETQMQGAVLREARMQGATLQEAQLQGATLIKVDLRGAYGSSSDESLPLPMRIDKRQGKKAELDTVIFSGGLKQEDVRRIKEKLIECQKNGWMMQEEAERIKAILEEHQGKPASNKPPGGTITGSYDKKEAEAIIAEYERDMVR